MIFTGEEFRNLTLKECFERKAGPEGVSLSRDYEKTCMTLGRFKNHCVFFLRCKKLDVVPKCVKLPCRVRSYEGFRIIEKANRALVRERLRMVERRKRDLLEDRNRLELHLEECIGKDEFKRYQALVDKKLERRFLSVRSRQRKKLETLIQNKHRRQEKTCLKEYGVHGLAVSKERWVINLSDRELTDDERSVLMKGMNFAPTPRSVPTLDIVASVTCALRSCESVQVIESTTQKIAGLLHRSVSGCTQRSNVTMKEREALKLLKSSEDVVVLPADKGNATVVMNREDYVRKVMDVVQHPPFERVDRCPKRRVEDRLNKFLWSLFQRGSITKPFYNSLHASACPLPRFYGLAKIHKKDVPVRPVISAVGTALYAASKYLASVLKPLVGRNGYAVANSKTFVREIAEIEVAADEEMVSFDVKSLYTSLPINRTIEVVRLKLEQDDTLGERSPLSVDEVVMLLEICLTSTYFSFQEKYYRLTDGVAMGSPVSSVVANLFMESLEEKAMNTAGSCKPKVWKRYVDDVFSIIRRAYTDRLLEHINNCDPQIVFTLEREEEGRLAFLDVAVNRSENRRLGTSVFRKETSTDRVLNFHSHHSQSAKIAVVRSLMNRLETHFTPEDGDGKRLEREHIFEILRANDYPERFIHRVEKGQHRPRNACELDKWVSIPYVKGISEAIAKILRPVGLKVAHSAAPWKWEVCMGIKDNIPEVEKKGVVYQIQCAECDAVYIGETLRTVKSRVQEHKRETEKGLCQRSAVAEHSFVCSHQISWESAKVLCQEQRWDTRKVKEALLISRAAGLGPMMNKDSGWRVSPAWQNLFKS